MRVNRRNSNWVWSNTVNQGKYLESTGYSRRITGWPINRFYNSPPIDSYSWSFSLPRSWSDFLVFSQSIQFHSWFPFCSYSAEWVDVWGALHSQRDTGEAWPCIQMHWYARIHHCLVYWIVDCTPLGRISLPISFLSSLPFFACGRKVEEGVESPGNGWNRRNRNWRERGTWLGVGWIACIPWTFDRSRIH